MVDKDWQSRFKLAETGEWERWSVLACFSLPLVLCLQLYVPLIAVALQVAFVLTIFMKLARFDSVRPTQEISTVTSTVLLVVGCIHVAWITLVLVLVGV